MADAKEVARERMRRTERRRRQDPAAHRRLMEALNPRQEKDQETQEAYERRQRRPGRSQPVRRTGINPRTGNVILDPRPPAPTFGPRGEIGAVPRRRRR